VVAVVQVTILTDQQVVDLVEVVLVVVKTQHQVTRMQASVERQIQVVAVAQDIFMVQAQAAQVL